MPKTGKIKSVISGKYSPVLTPTLRTIFDDSAIGQFYVSQYELLAGLAAYIRPKRGELRMIKKKARNITRKNIVELILMADSNQLAVFARIILGRKEFRELCRYLRWMYAPRYNLGRIISILRFVRDLKKGYKRLMTLLAVTAVALVKLSIPCVGHVIWGRI